MLTPTVDNINRMLNLALEDAAGKDVLAKDWLVAELLVRKGAKPNIAVPEGPYNGLTPLHFAAAHGGLERFRSKY